VGGGGLSKWEEGLATLKLQSGHCQVETPTYELLSGFTLIFVASCPQYQIQRLRLLQAQERKPSTRAGPNPSFGWPRISRQCTQASKDPLKYRPVTSPSPHTNPPEIAATICDCASLAFDATSFAEEVAIIGAYNGTLLSKYPTRGNLAPVVWDQC
jgi:hypothetical protein